MAVETPCGFCGEKRKITNEHVFGQWIGRLFGAEREDMMVRNAFGRDGMPQSRWYTSSLDHKNRVACKDCNSGWMQKLEDKVAPIVTPMIFGQGRSLSLKDQIIIATWAVKTAMVQEFSHQRRRYFTPEERHSLMDDAVPSQLGARIWAAHYIGPEIPGIHCLSSGLISADGAVSSLLSTLAIGKFVLQVFVERVTASDPVRPPIRPGPWHRVLIGVWPPSRFADIERVLSWPPLVGIGKKEFDELVDRFMAFGAQRPPYRHDRHV